MNRTAPLVVVLALLVAGVAAPVAASLPQATGPTDRALQTGTPTPEGNGSAEPAAPGARFAGVVDVQKAEVESELEGRAFGIRIAQARSNSSKAAVVGDKVAELTSRAEALRERKQELDAALEDGNISHARYRAEVAGLAARIAALERQIDRTEAASAGLPTDLLASRGVDATAIAKLRNDSRSLAGPDVAEIARTIAGPNPGLGLAGDGGPPGAVPGRVGPPNASDGGVATGPNGSTVPPNTNPGRNASGPPAGSGGGNGTDGDSPGFLSGVLP